MTALVSQARAKQPTAPSVAARSGSLLQRQCACGQHTVGGGTCEACRKRQSPAPGRRQSRQFAGSRDARHAGHCPPGEMGGIVCNYADDRLEVTVNCEHRLGDCVTVHEEVHKADPFMIAACHGASLCRKRGDGGVKREELEPGLQEQDIPGLCNWTFDRWAMDHRASTEVRAYTAEMACLDRVIDANCGAAQSRARNIGGGITGAALGVGGAIGGGFIGAALMPRNAGLGAFLGASLGSALGAVGYGVGRLIGGAAADAEASPEDCTDVKDARGNAEKNRDYWSKLDPTPVPNPFNDKGEIINRQWIKGVLKPGAAGPGSQAPSPAASQSRMIASRAPRTRSLGDLTGLPPFVATPRDGRGSPVLAAVGGAGA